MKIKILIICMLISSFSFTQIIDNKLNIGLGGGLFVPLNLAEVHDGDFQYPSLWGNYPASFNFIFEAEYNYNNVLWFGTSVSYTTLSNWSYTKNDLFILSNPTSNIISLGLEGDYFPKSYQIKNNYFVWGFLAGTNLNIYSFESDGITFNPSESPSVYPSISNSMGIGFSTGLTLKKDFSNRLGAALKAKYSFGFVQNEYFLDKGLHSFQVSFILKYRLLLDKQYRYYY